jgi:hypothetical protein
MPDYGVTTGRRRGSHDDGKHDWYWERETMIDGDHDTSGPSGPTDGLSASDAVMGKRSGLRYRVLAVCFSLIVFVGSVWFIGRTFRWGELAGVLRDVNVPFLIVGGGASIVAYWVLRTLRWYCFDGPTPTCHCWTSTCARPSR